VAIVNTVPLVALTTILPVLPNAMVRVFALEELNLPTVSVKTLRFNVPAVKVKVPAAVHSVGLPVSVKAISDLLTVVLKDMFIETPEGWFQPRCDAGIKDYHALVNRNRTNGKAGGRPRRNPDETQSVTTGKVTINHKPETIVEAKPKQSRGTRLPADWLPSEDQIQFCKTHRTDLSPQTTADRFRDYWSAQPGAKGLKLDWDATWRNWVRAERTQPTAQPSGSRPSWDRRQR
jgi:hypothetical protein